MKKSLRPIITEGIATFILCFFDSLITIQEEDKSVSLLVQSLLIVIIIMWCCEISGAHFNPSVSLAFALTGRLDPKSCVLYITGQLAGSFFAGFLLDILSVDKNLFAAKKLGVPNVSFTSAASSNFRDSFVAFSYEAAFTAILLIIILECTENKKMNANQTGIAVVSTVALGSLALANTSGACFNPGRAFGPAFFSNSTFSDAHWIYYVAPPLGAFVGSTFFDKFLKIRFPITVLPNNLLTES